VLCRDDARLRAAGKGHSLQPPVISPCREHVVVRKRARQPSPGLSTRADMR
jgi:hypothetical protein